jgi:hypothetical protein
MFYIDVAKIDSDVAYVASFSEACCKRSFKMFLFQTYVASISIWMLHMFHTYMSQEYVRNVLAVSVLCCNKCFHIASYKCYIWMLHMFYTHVSSICSNFFFFCFRHMLHPSVSYMKQRVMGHNIDEDPFLNINSGF